MVMHYGISPGYGAVRDSAGDAGPMGWSWKRGIAAYKSFSRCQWCQVIGAGLWSRPLLFLQNDLFFKSLGPLVQRVPTLPFHQTWGGLYSTVKEASLKVRSAFSKTQKGSENNRGGGRSLS